MPRKLDIVRWPSRRREEGWRNGSLDQINLRSKLLGYAQISYGNMIKNLGVLVGQKWGLLTHALGRFRATACSTQQNVPFLESFNFLNFILSNIISSLGSGPPAPHSLLRLSAIVLSQYHPQQQYLKASLKDFAP